MPYMPPFWYMLALSAFALLYAFGWLALAGAIAFL